jgi:hypothetical protein
MAPLLRRRSRSSEIRPTRTRHRDDDCFRSWRSCSEVYPSFQIEQNGVVQFAAYDTFHPECIFFGAGIEPKLIQSLVTEGVIR